MNTDKRVVVAGWIRPGATTLNVDPTFGDDDDWVVAIHDASENAQEPDGLGFLWAWSDEHTSIWDEDTDEYEDDIEDRLFWAKGAW